MKCFNDSFYSIAISTAHAVRFHDRLIRDAQLSDVGWAPISSALILYLYGNGIFAGEIAARHRA